MSSWPQQPLFTDTADNILCPSYLKALQPEVGTIAQKERGINIHVKNFPTIGGPQRVIDIH